MNILLTEDEKAIAVQDEMERVGEGQMRDYSDIVAKAQLKKVVEWLDTFEFYDDFGGESGSMFRDTIKQALLKEVE